MHAKDAFVRLMEQGRGLSDEGFVQMIEGGRRTPARDLVSIKDLATELGVSAPQRVKRGRRHMYRRTDVQRWLEQSERPSSA